MKHITNVLAIVVGGTIILTIIAFLIILILQVYVFWALDGVAWIDKVVNQSEFRFQYKYCDNNTTIIPTD